MLQNTPTLFSKAPKLKVSCQDLQFPLKEIMRSSIRTDTHHLRVQWISACSKYRPHPLRRHPPSQVTSSTQRPASTSTKWSDEDRTRIHILGINSYGVLYGHSLGNLQARPPLTYMVPSNQNVIQLASLNGEIEVIEGGDHYVTDGFDVEAVGRPPIESIFERPSKKYLSFNTLTLPAKTKFDIRTEPQPQDSYLPFRGDYPQYDYGKPVKFNYDPSELGYGSDGELVVESRLHERKISTDDLLLLKNEEAKKKLGPIKNLICAVDAQVVVHALQSQKHRLNRDSTILFTQKGMRIMEMVNEQVFPDPETRPTYIPGIFSHAVWKSNDHATSPDFAPEMESGLSGLRASVSPKKLSVKHGDLGSLILGPVVPVEGEQVTHRRRRQQSANYLVSALLAAPSLRARCLPAHLLLRVRLRDLAINSVVGPSTVHFQCNNAGLLANEERIVHLQSRLREAARIVQTFDSYLTYGYLEKRLGDYLVMSGDRVHPMFKNVLAGRKSDIEWHSGWLVEQSRILANGGAKLCPGHEEDLGFIQEITEAAAMLRTEEDEAQRLLRTKQRRTQRATNCEEKVPNRVERTQEELAIILHNQRMSEERKKKKRQKTPGAIQEIVFGSDGGSNTSGMKEVKEVDLDPGMKEIDISGDAASVHSESSESQDSPPKARGSNSGSICLAPEAMSLSANASRSFDNKAGSNTVEPIT